MGNKCIDTTNQVLLDDNNNNRRGKITIPGIIGYGTYEGELLKGKPHGYGVVIWNGSQNIFFSKWEFGKPMKSSEGYILFDNLNYNQKYHLEMNKTLLKEYRKFSILMDWKFRLIFGNFGSVEYFEYNKMITIEKLNKIKINDEKLKNIIIKYYKKIYMKKFNFFNKLLKNEKFVDLEICFQ